jgi:putative transposase
VSPAARRRAAKHVVESGLCRPAPACRALGLSRSGYYRVPEVSRSSRLTDGRIVALSLRHPRYGYRFITALMRRGGARVNAKRVARVRRAEGLQVRKRQRRLRRAGPERAERLSPAHRNHVWSRDFVSDQTESGSPFRILTLIDEHTRQCLAAHAARSIRSQDVLRVLEEAMREHGFPEHIRSDNGPEFIAHAVQDWLKSRSIQALYIKPGSPWENGRIESFHDKLRDECLNREMFSTLTEASVIIGDWRHEYNTFRPHSSLQYRTPAEAAARAVQLRSAAFDSAQPPHEIITPTLPELHL